MAYGIVNVSKREKLVFESLLQFGLVLKRAGSEYPEQSRISEMQGHASGIAHIVVSIQHFCIYLFYSN